MNPPPHIWLASYPRSGNTLLRTILWQCFNAPSASIYEDDLGAHSGLQSMAGHVGLNQNGQLWFPEGKQPLIKTHELPPDNNKAIYVVRDGRETAVSLWRFYKQAMSIEDVIQGQHRFGTWANHIESWDPWQRPNTLLVSYEAMLEDLPTVLLRLSEFLELDVVNQQLPTRENMSKVGGKWVRPKSNWRSQLFGPKLKLFNQVNKATMKRLEYT